MPEVKYTIKSKADLKAVKETERAVKDLGRETEKTQRKIKETTAATKEADRALDKASVSGGKFAKSIGKQVFGSLVSFAVVTRAVNALRTIFAPALEGATRGAEKLGDALGNYIAQAESIQGLNKALEGSFGRLAETLDQLAESNAKFTAQVNPQFRGKIDFSGAPASLRAPLEEFQAQQAAQSDFDRRKLSEIDRKASEQIQLEEARGGVSPTRRAAILDSARKEKARILAESDAATLGRVGELQGRFPDEASLIEQANAFQAAGRNRQSFVSAMQERGRREQELEKLREKAGQSPASVAAFQSQISAKESEIRQARALEDQAKNAARDSATRYLALEKKSGFGVTTQAGASEIFNLGQTYLNQAVSGAAGLQNQNALISQGIAGEGAFSGQITPLLQRNANLDQAKEIANQRNQKEQELLNLLRSGFGDISATIQSIKENIGQLKNREKSLRE